MILIAHRGNTRGKKVELENKPSYILNALERGFHCEIDVWYINGKFKLGHDEPQYEFPFELLENFYLKLWIHCKNKEALEKLYSIDPTGTKLNYFWHDTDYATLTSKGYIWSVNQVEGGILVMPEATSTQVIDTTRGICSDLIEQYA